MAALALDSVIVGSQIIYGGITYNVTQVDGPAIPNSNVNPGQLDPLQMHLTLIKTGDDGFNTQADYAGLGNNAGGPP